MRHQHADAPHPLALLRARGERPRGRRITDKSDEITASHIPLQVEANIQRSNHSTRDPAVWEQIHAVPPV
jgi:hypothetical protein